jgi:hypothetical protein
MKVSKSCDVRYVAYILLITVEIGSSVGVRCCQLTTSQLGWVVLWENRAREMECRCCFLRGAS